MDALEDDENENAVEIFEYIFNRQLSLDTMSSDDIEVDVMTAISGGGGGGGATTTMNAENRHSTAAMTLYAEEVGESWDIDGDTTEGAVKEILSHSQEDEEIGVGANQIPPIESMLSATSEYNPNEDTNIEITHEDIITDEDDINTEPTANSNSSCCSNWNWSHILYLSLFSTIGVTMRAFMSRFFGGDCEANSLGDPINDWLWPVSHRICVTASGTTQQYGGALFLDLPANMFGSFIMGIMTSYSTSWPVMPCLAHDHPLQENKGLHVGIRTALCGTLTTFSSWNTQMILMMDGTANPYLGSQVLAAIFGYVLGLQASLVSFRAGRTISAWFHLRNNPHVFDDTRNKEGIQRSCHHDHLSWLTPLTICTVIGTLITMYILGDVLWGIPYYRQLWIACLVAPVGTITRWKLSTLNGKFSCRGYFWFPTGTFLANFLGSILSALLSALQYIDSEHDTGSMWKIPTLSAISLGMAGSLSTVSTYAKESVEIAEKYPSYDKKAFMYSHGTMLVCCLAGLLVYSPIVRYV